MLLSTLTLLTAAASVAYASPAKSSSNCTPGFYSYGGTSWNITCHASLPKGKFKVVGTATGNSIDDCVAACYDYDNGATPNGACFTTTFNSKTSVCNFYETVQNGTRHVANSAIAIYQG